MIVLITDFGLEGPYIGQMTGRLYAKAASIPVINLFADVPSFNIKAASYLIAAYSEEFPENTVFLCVIDPGVGSDKYFPVVVEANGKYFVGPGNLLFSVVKAHNKKSYKQYKIGWRPSQLSRTFHGRDLYAPVAVWLALGEREKACLELVDNQIEPYAPIDLFEFIYIDKYGNAITGISRDTQSLERKLRINGRIFAKAHTFSNVLPESGFFYLNSNGLIEIAVNQGNAAQLYDMEVGDAVSWVN